MGKLCRAQGVQWGTWCRARGFNGEIVQVQGEVQWVECAGQAHDGSIDTLLGIQRMQCAHCVGHRGFNGDMVQRHAGGVGKIDTLDRNRAGHGGERNQRAPLT